MKKGYFGDFGGRFAPELLMPPLLELEEAMERIMSTPAFGQELGNLLEHYVGRPTALYHCARLSEELGFGVWLKREDLAHTGAHKINNTVGQALLAKHMGKTKLVAETGAGQHGVATATAAALLGLECLVYMGAEDVVRQAHNVQRMELLGARVQPVESGSRTLKDAINAAMRHWIAEQEQTHYCLGSAVGPHPFPLLVRELQAVIGREALEQFRRRTGSLPDRVVACVGGGSNAIGMFHAFVPHPEVALIGVEAAGDGSPGCCHSATLSTGTTGVLHGTMTKLLQTPEGQILPSHSLAPGLDYPGVGPEHAHLQALGRAEYVSVTDNQALAAFMRLARTEGILAALESSHALAYAIGLAGTLPETENVVICLSGRGDKDLEIVRAALSKSE
ncbi:tryptophan synthase beta chain [Desulfonatronum thiosulfatophilum]|uniref:Tryptophan synthase beta chain n=1 Tax=Desulfonatronum thiosulfatophilum TaxID=617002 RepID=A0A1G6B1F5_9BACT|nr:tryptophan synthase subunit beta [Desulfonatronum thiosulfatophilum]SDB14395.1 tryptophan synthase beta chain [Desulfonatronum thiosulfatophilum]